MEYNRYPVRACLIALLVPCLAFPAYAGGWKSNLCFGMLALSSVYYVVPDMNELKSHSPQSSSTALAIGSDQLYSDWEQVASLASQIKATVTLSRTGYLARVAHSSRSFYVLKSDLTGVLTLIERKGTEFPEELMYALRSFYLTATASDTDQQRYLSQKEVAIRTNVRIGEILTIAILLSGVIKSGKSLKTWYKNSKAEKKRKKNLSLASGSSSIASTPVASTDQRKQPEGNPQNARTSDDDDDRRRRAQELIAAANSGDDDGFSLSSRSSQVTTRNEDMISISGFETNISVESSTNDD